MAAVDFANVSRHAGLGAPGRGRVQGALRRVRRLAVRIMPFRGGVRTFLRIVQQEQRDGVGLGLEITT